MNKGIFDWEGGEKTFLFLVLAFFLYTGLAFAASGTDSFSYTGSKQTMDVSGTNDRAKITLLGAEGADGQDSDAYYDSRGGSGGNGAEVIGFIDLSNYQQLTLWVGESPSKHDNWGWGDSKKAGGWGWYNGGNGVCESSCGGGGGGSTAILGDGQFIAAADGGGGGGGGGGYSQYCYDCFSAGGAGGGGARGGDGGSGYSYESGGTLYTGEDGEDGEGSGYGGGGGSGSSHSSGGNGGGGGGEVSGVVDNPTIKEGESTGHGYIEIKYVSIPQNKDIWFENSDEGHKFEVKSIFEHGDGDDAIVSCDVKASDSGGNTVTYSGSLDRNTGNSNTAYCNQTIVYSNHSSWSHLENLDVEATVEDKYGQSASASGLHSFPNNDIELQNVEFQEYDRRHAFNLSVNLSDPDAVGEEVSNCDFSFEDQEGNLVEAQDINSENLGSGVYNCFYSNINASMPWKSDIDQGFEPAEQIDIGITASDVHGSEVDAQKSHPVSNTVPEISDPSPENEAVIDEEEIILNVTAKDKDIKDEELTAYFFNESNNEFLGMDSQLYTVDNLYYSDLVENIGTGNLNRWRVKVSDGYENSTEIFEFIRGPGDTYITNTGIGFEYSSLSMAQNSQRDFFVTVENSFDESKDLKTYLEGVNATFLEYNDDQTSVYTLEPFEDREFLVRVRPDDISGSSELRVITEEVNLGLNRTKSIPVYVRDQAPGAEPQGVPGIEIVHLLMLSAVSTTLYFLSL